MTWQVSLAATALAGGVIVDVGVVKSAARGWVDRHLDHGVLIAPLLLRLVRDVVRPDLPVALPIWVSEVRVGETARNEACIRRAVLGPDA